MSDETAVLHTRRHLPYPPDAVYAAIVSPERLARWWGPAGFRNTFTRCEVVVGGEWVFTMHGPDGRDYPNRCVFAALEPGRRVEIAHVCAPLFTLTVTLQAVDGGTVLDWRQDFHDPAVTDALRAVCVPANEQNLDRLHAELTAAAPSDGR